ncbi:glycosylated lysosomal membrane protein-like [Zerene cesonia]|uniref:glycosylated lysosomal membrane protein-like n=1 Tax=Zerene cesonia TaxID=33412 RepID=UPI0018E52D45|nr:glycosylated lysosomal membrane protein-like [Zerene cesonia]
MFPLVIRIYYALLITLIFSAANGLDRKISSILNPGCNDCPMNTTTLVYVRADGDSDTIHQIWDFTRHLPTMVMSVGSLNSSLNIKWDGTEPKDFSWSEEPRYTFATVMDKLIEYDDLNDNGYISPQYPQKEYSCKRISWALKESILTEQEAMVHVVGTVHSERHERDGFVHMKVDLLPFRDYAVELPHLIHTANSSLVDISLVNLTVSKEYNASRFALHFVLVSTDDASDTMHYTMRKSLDDEHTPGVFEIIEIKTPSLFKNEEGGYLQFRPVGYTDVERNVASSTMAHVSNFNR